MPFLLVMMKHLGRRFSSAVAATPPSAIPSQHMHHAWYRLVSIFYSFLLPRIVIATRWRVAEMQHHAYTGAAAVAWYHRMITFFDDHGQSSTPHPQLQVMLCYSAYLLAYPAVRACLQWRRVVEARGVRHDLDVPSGIRYTMRSKICAFVICHTLLSSLRREFIWRLVHLSNCCISRRILLLVWEPG
ncbi:hypothetical protein QBC44DRAFT_1895 [Cladorrhinum sp. PSN332]|nr:hypothetical protein QBC44DRAFT_1895 [Cladorrhinum sp. PSN332]